MTTLPPPIGVKLEFHIGYCSVFILLLKSIKFEFMYCKVHIENYVFNEIFHNFGGSKSRSDLNNEIYNNDSISCAYLNRDYKLILVFGIIYLYLYRLNI